MMAQLITITFIATVLVVTWERYDLSGPSSQGTHLIRLPLSLRPPSQRHRAPH